MSKNKHLAVSGCGCISMTCDVMFVGNAILDSLGLARACEWLMVELTCRRDGAHWCLGEPSRKSMHTLLYRMNQKSGVGNLKSGLGNQKSGRPGICFYLHSQGRRCEWKTNCTHRHSDASIDCASLPLPALVNRSCSSEAQEFAPDH